MRKYGKVLVGVLLLVLVLVGSGVLYRYLAGQYRPGALSEAAPKGEGETQTDDGAMTGNRPESGSADGTDAGTPDGAQEEETSPAPDFTVENADGEQVRLSDFTGRPVVLNFWASWCGPCKSEMPGFQNLYDAYGGDVEFVLVNLTDGSRETTESAMTFIEEQGYTFPVYFDVDREAATAYYVTSIPATYFIDSEGNLVAYGLGALQEEDVKTGLEMILAD